jgi:hypothetical protein
MVVRNFCWPVAVQFGHARLGCFLAQRRCYSHCNGL